MGLVITTTHKFLELSVADIRPDDVVFYRWDKMAPKKQQNYH
jgi:hypothetical protein